MSSNPKIDLISITNEIIKQRHYEKRVTGYATMSSAELKAEVLKLVTIDRSTCLPDHEFRKVYKPYMNESEP